MPTKKKATKKVTKRTAPGPTERRIMALENTLRGINNRLDAMNTTLGSLFDGDVTDGARVQELVSLFRQANLTTEAFATSVVKDLADIKSKVTTMQNDNESVKRRLGGLFGA